MEHLGACVARLRRELWSREDRYAAEHVHELIVIQGPERPSLCCDERQVPSSRLRERAEKLIRARDAAVCRVPRSVEKGERGRAARRPGLSVQIEPRAAVVPVLAAGRHDHLVRADFTHVVVIVLRIVEHGIHGIQKSEDSRRSDRREGGHASHPASHCHNRDGAD